MIVYVLYDPGNKVYKVGSAYDFHKRFIQHRCSNPFLKVVWLYREKNRDDEKNIHQILREYKLPVRREWFIDHPDVLVKIATYFEELSCSISCVYKEPTEVVRELNGRNIREIERGKIVGLVVN